MAEPGDKVTLAYRGFPREEPPPVLDAAILAAARESVRPRARNRWAGPMSIAAVLVLGLGVSLRMQTERPGIETSAPPPSASSAEYPAAQSAAIPAPEARAKDASLDDRARAEPKAFADAPVPDAALPPAPLAAQSAAAPAPASPAASLAPLRAKREAAGGTVTQETARPDADARATELEHIARLRRDGRDAEADKALEEFRRHHPEYRIPDAVWERVRPR